MRDAVSQAVAFNMFLAFFPILLVALGLVSSSLRGKGGQELAVATVGEGPCGYENIMIGRTSTEPIAPCLGDGEHHAAGSAEPQAERLSACCVR